VSATKIKESVAYTSNEAAKKNIEIPEEVSSLEVAAVEIEWVFIMTLRSGTRKWGHAIAREAEWGEGRSPRV
jgi:hypothetical protein